MKVILLVLIAVISVQSMTDSEALQVIERIDSTKFGHTLFETLYVQMQGGNPLESLIETLEALESRYSSEQKDDDSQNRSDQDQCDVDIKALDQELASTDYNRIVLEAKLEGELYPKRSVYVGIIKAKETESNQYKKKIDELNTERQKENNVFEEKMKDHEETLNIIVEARRLFEGLVQGNSVSFLQGSTHTIDKTRILLLQKHLQEGAHHVNRFKYRRSFSQIFKMLITISSKAQSLLEQGQFERIVTLCENLLKNIHDHIDLERFTEDKRIEAYKKAFNLINVSLVQTQRDLANLQAQLDSLNNQIDYAEADLRNNNDRFNVYTERRTDRYTECEWAAHDYQNRRKARDHKRQIVSDLIGLLNKNLRVLKEQIALRIAAGEQI